MYDRPLLGELDPARANQPIVEEILKLRQQQAALHGKESFAHYQCEDTMAKEPRAAMDLLEKVRTIQAVTIQAITIQAVTIQAITIQAVTTQAITIQAVTTQAITSRELRWTSSRRSMAVAIIGTCSPALVARHCSLVL